ncbi:MAG TPA: BrnT family toxin [Roseiarcus sp.]
MVDEVVSPLFEWDEGNRRHCQKHGVPITEIEALLRGSPRIAPDLKHAHLEDRLIAVGRTARGRPLFVAFTIRGRSGQQTIRADSARYMHEAEARNYEAQGSDHDHR